MLRLYEWERIRQVPFQIDAYLPDGSPVLFVRVRIVNPHDREVPMYWWSNIAVPETAETRVIVPADAALQLWLWQARAAAGADPLTSTRHGRDLFDHH